MFMQILNIAPRRQRNQGEREETVVVSSERLIEGERVKKRANKRCGVIFCGYGIMGQNRLVGEEEGRSS